MGVARGEAEVGQLIVQQKTLDHLARTKRIFDGGGHGQCVAVRVHDADVAGAVFGLVGHGGQAGLAAAGVAGLGCLHALCTDELGATGEVAGVEQAHPAAAGGLHEVGVGHIEGAVGKGQACRLGVEVQPLGRGQAVLQRQAGGVGVVQDAQNLAHGDGARAGGRKAAEAVVLRAGAVVGAQRLAFFGLVAGQVGQAQAAGVGGVLLHLVHHGLGHWAFVQGAAAPGGDQAQHGGQLGVFQHMAHGPGFACGVVEVGGCYRVFGQKLFVRQQGVQPRAELEAALGQLNGGLEQGGPGQLAMLAVRQLQHAHGAGNAHRAATDHSVMKNQGLAVGIEKKAFVGGGGRRLSPVIGLHLATARVQQEGATANPAGLGFDQCQHHLHCNGCIHGRATGLEHLVASISGQRVGRCHRKLGGGPARFFGVAGRPLGLGGHGVAQARAAAAGGQQGGCGQ